MHYTTTMRYYPDYYYLLETENEAAIRSKLSEAAKLAADVFKYIPEKLFLESLKKIAQASVKSTKKLDDIARDLSQKHPDCISSSAQRKIENLQDEPRRLLLAIVLYHLDKADVGSIQSLTFSKKIFNAIITAVLLAEYAPNDTLNDLYKLYNCFKTIIDAVDKHEGISGSEPRELKFIFTWAVKLGTKFSTIRDRKLVYASLGGSLASVIILYFIIAYVLYKTDYLESVWEAKDPRKWVKAIREAYREGSWKLRIGLTFLILVLVYHLFSAGYLLTQIFTSAKASESYEKLVDLFRKLENEEKQLV